MCKVTRQDVSFQDIMKCYRLQPQSKSHVSFLLTLMSLYRPLPLTISNSGLQIYRSVLLSSRGRRDSSSSGNSRHSGSNSPVGQDAKERIRSSSTLPVPHPNSQPPTPTRLAGTGSQFDFGEERGDLIMFYNQVYVPELKNYIMKFTVEVSLLMTSIAAISYIRVLYPCRTLRRFCRRCRVSPAIRSLLAAAFPRSTTSSSHQ